MTTMTGQTWHAGAASFLGMWIVMMVPMMLPSLVPMLWRYRESVGAIGTTRGAVLTAIVSAGYFLVWSAAGLGAYPVSVVLTRATPIAVGIIVLIAGTIQFTGWKSRHLDCCRQAPGRGVHCRRIRHCLAAWPPPRRALLLQLSGTDNDASDHRHDGRASDGCRGGSHHRRTSRTGRRARRASHRGRRRRRRRVADRTSRRARMTHRPTSP